MSLPPNSAGTFHHLQPSFQAHSLDALVDKAGRQASTVRVPVQSGPVSSGYSAGIDTPSYLNATSRMIDPLLFPPLCMEPSTGASQYQGIAQWNLSVPSSTLRQPSSHNQSPGDSLIPLPEQPSSTSSNPMLTPYYYEPEQSQAVHQGAGDYQHWVESYNAQMHYGYPPEHQQSPGMLQIPYTESHAPHPSVPASIVNPGAMQQPLQNQYQFAHYMTPAAQPQRDAYAQGYAQTRFVDPTQRNPQNSQQPHHTSNARQPRYMPSVAPSSMQEQATSLPAVYQQPMHHQFASMHDPGMTGVQLQYSQQSPLSAAADGHGLTAAGFTFEYPAPPAEILPSAANSSYTPSSQHSGLPSTPSSRPDTSDDRAPQQATTSNAAAAQQQRQPAPIAPRLEPPSFRAPTKTLGKKRARRNPPGDYDSGSEDDYYPTGTAVPPLKGPDGNATRLCVFFILPHDYR